MSVRLYFVLQFLALGVIGAGMTINAWTLADRTPSPWDLLCRLAAVTAAGISLYCLLMIFVVARTKYKRDRL